MSESDVNFQWRQHAVDTEIETNISHVSVTYLVKCLADERVTERGLLLGQRPLHSRLSTFPFLSQTFGRGGADLKIPNFRGGGLDLSFRHKKGQRRLSGCPCGNLRDASTFGRISCGWVFFQISICIVAAVSWLVLLGTF